MVQKFARANGAFDAVKCSHWAEGGLGAADLAEAVVKATQQPSNFKFLYVVEVKIVLFTSIITFSVVTLTLVKQITKLQIAFLY